MEPGDIVNYLPTGELGKIAKEPAAAIGTDNTRFVLQGVDENIGVAADRDDPQGRGTEAILTNPKV